MRNSLLANQHVSYILFGEPFFQLFVATLNNIIEIKVTHATKGNQAMYLFTLSKNISNNQRVKYELNKLATNEMVIDPLSKPPPQWVLLKNQNQYTNISGAHYLQESHRNDSLQANRFESDHSSYLYDAQLDEFSINQIQEQVYTINLEVFHAFFFHI